MVWYAAVGVAVVAGILVLVEWKRRADEERRRRALWSTRVANFACAVGGALFSALTIGALVVVGIANHKRAETAAADEAAARKRAETAATRALLDARGRSSEAEAHERAGASASRRFAAADAEHWCIDAAESDARADADRRASAIADPLVDAARKVPPDVQAYTPLPDAHGAVLHRESITRPTDPMDATAVLDSPNGDARVLALTGECQAMLHDLTLSLRARLPLLLRERHGDHWKVIVRPSCPPPRFVTMDFSAALEVVRTAGLVPDARVVLRSREFRNQLAHQVRLSVVRLERGQTVLRELATALGLPVPAALTPSAASTATSSAAALPTRGGSPARAVATFRRADADVELLDTPQRASNAAASGLRDGAVAAAAASDTPRGAPGARRAVSVGEAMPTFAPETSSPLSATDAIHAAVPCAPDAARTDGERLHRIGDSLVAMGRYTEAADAYGRSMRAAQPTVVLLLKRCRACAQLGEWVLAQQDAEDALELDATAADAYVALGDALVKQELVDEALRVFQRGKAAAPRDTRLALRVRDLSARATAAAVGIGESSRDLLPGQWLPLTAPSATDMCRDGALSFASPSDAARHFAQLMESGQFVLAAHKLRDGGKVVEALASYERAIAMGNAEAMYNAALLMKPSRRTVVVDAGRALQLLRRAAAEPPGFILGDRWLPNLGVAEAENGLGCSYRDGDGVDVDGVTARRWFVRGARHGNVWAQNSLGCCFREGIGGDVDGAQARAWFEKAARLHLPAAQVNLGQMLLNGEGGPSDIPRARELLQAAATRGHATAIEELATMDASGVQRAPRPRDATARRREAAERGDVDAMAAYAEALLGGYDGAPADAKAAEAMLASAAARGHVPSALRLGRLLSATRERAADGYAHLLAAATSGSAEAQYLVGVALLEGNGVAVDVAAARRWLLRAQHQGVAAAVAALKRAATQPEFERGLAAREHARGEAATGMTARDRVTRDLLAHAPPGAAEPIRNVFSLFADADRMLHPQDVDPLPLPWPAAMEHVARRAAAGGVTARRYMDGLAAMDEAAVHARAGRHARAVELLARAYELADLLPSYHDDAVAFSASITATLDADANHADATVCWLRKAPRDERRSIATLVSVAHRAVAVHGSHVRLREVFGSTLGFAKDWPAALLQFTRVLDLDPRRTDNYYHRGVCHANMSNFSAATADFLAFVTAAPSDARKVAEAWYKLASITVAGTARGAAGVAAPGTSTPAISDDAVTQALARAAEYYARGEAAERGRLPVFPVVSVPDKALVRALLDVDCAMPSARATTAARRESARDGDANASSPASARSGLCAVCAKACVPLWCSRCRAVMYCSDRCQRADWSVHKSRCTGPRRADAAR